jgi:hypothetical protein
MAGDRGDQRTPEEKNPPQWEAKDDVMEVIGDRDTKTPPEGGKA